MATISRLASNALISPGSASTKEENLGVATLGAEGKSVIQVGDGISPFTLRLHDTDIGNCPWDQGQILLMESADGLTLATSWMSRL